VDLGDQQSNMPDVGDVFDVALVSVLYLARLRRAEVPE
jgi:hypothetical protein